MREGFSKRIRYFCITKHMLRLRQGPKSWFITAFYCWFLFINTIQPLDADSTHVWRSLTPTLILIIVIQCQLAEDGHGWFSSANGGLFIVTQRDTSVIDIRPAFVKHHTWACAPMCSQHKAARTHACLNPGLHGDCFNAYVNLPLSSVSVFRGRKKRGPPIKKNICSRNTLLSLFCTLLWE